MERISGRELSRAHDLLETLSPEQRREMARTLFGVVLRQVLHSGVFHADLHAGNVFVDHDGSLALLDFGSVGRLDRSARTGIGRLLYGVDRGDSVAATDALLEVLDRPSGLDDRALERDLGAVIARYRHGMGESSAGLFGELMSIVVRHGFSVPPQVAATFRSLGALEGTLRILDPGLDLMDTARAEAKDLFGERLNPTQVRATLEDQLLQVLPVLQRLPRRVDAIAETLQRGEFTARVRLLADERDRTFLSGLVQQLIVTLLAGAAAIGGILLILVDQGPELSEGIGLYPVLGATLFLFAFVLAARALAVAFRHDASEHWGARH
jgi:ubiquinone biosynthesis protein